MASRRCAPGGWTPGGPAKRSPTCGRSRSPVLSHLALMARIWALRENLTTYDAAYDALAQAVPAPLVTANQRLAAAPGLGCEVAVLR